MHRCCVAQRIHRRVHILFHEIADLHGLAPDIVQLLIQRVVGDQYVRHWFPTKILYLE